VVIVAKREETPMFEYSCEDCESKMEPAEAKKCCGKDYCKECLMEHFREEHRGDAS
jgi:late competence protein required for DNA uptake (superfamily II DNA/RNA helicase)